MSALKPSLEGCLLELAQALLTVVKHPLFAQLERPLDAQVVPLKRNSKSNDVVGRNSPSGYYALHAKTINLATKKKRMQLTADGRCIICRKLKEPDAGTRCLRCAAARSKKPLRSPSVKQTRRACRNPIGTVKFARNGGQTQVWVKTGDRSNGKAGWIYWMNEPQAKKLGISDGQVVSPEAIKAPSGSKRSGVPISAALVGEVESRLALGAAHSIVSVEQIADDSVWGKELRREFGKNWKRGYKAFASRLETAH